MIVRLSERRGFEAQLIRTDEHSNLAVPKILARGSRQVTLDQSAIQVDAWGPVIGSPFGFEHSVSATGRNLPSEDYVPFIQTEVAITSAKRVVY